MLMLKKYEDENYIESKIKTVEIDQVNSRFVLLLRWMEISFLLKEERKNACSLLFCFGYMET